MVLYLPGLGAFFHHLTYKNNNVGHAKKIKFMNRPDISRLNKNRSIYLSVGFVLSLSLTIMGFNYTVYEQDNAHYIEQLPIDEEELVEVVRTVYPERKSPPPTISPSEQVIEQEVEFIEVPDPQPLEPEVLPTPDPVDIPEPRNYVAPPSVKPDIVEVVEDKPDEIFIVVEQMPRFAGCEDAELSDGALKTCADQRLLEYIYGNIKYPSIARENGIEGTVFATFVVEKDGSITIPKVLRDIGGGCGKEVLRVIKQMPDWIPGAQRGRKVRVQFNLPVKFSLQ